MKVDDWNKLQKKHIQLPFAGIAKTHYLDEFLDLLCLYLTQQYKFFNKNR